METQGSISDLLCSYKRATGAPAFKSLFQGAGTKESLGAGSGLALGCALEAGSAKVAGKRLASISKCSVAQEGELKGLATAPLLLACPVSALSLCQPPGGRPRDSLNTPGLQPLCVRGGCGYWDVLAALPHSHGVGAAFSLEARGPKRKLLEGRCGHLTVRGGGICAALPALRRTCRGP